MEKSSRRYRAAQTRRVWSAETELVDLVFRKSTCEKIFVYLHWAVDLDDKCPRLKGPIVAEPSRTDENSVPLRAPGVPFVRR